MPLGSSSNQGTSSVIDQFHGSTRASQANSQVLYTPKIARVSSRRANVSVALGYPKYPSHYGVCRDLAEQVESILQQESIDLVTKKRFVAFSEKQLSQELADNSNPRITRAFIDHLTRESSPSSGSAYSQDPAHWNNIEVCVVGPECANTLITIQKKFENDGFNSLLILPSRYVAALAYSMRNGHSLATHCIPNPALSEEGKIEATRLAKACASNLQNTIASWDHTQIPENTTIDVYIEPYKASDWNVGYVTMRDEGERAVFDCISRSLNE
ncbi:uncharacterized protein I303_101525 [Kwoniella dejecticola CBS 10117]|uniref:Uncharacterized protein n=1 Tax=Kwoniella dejecticola CBS 10117 TaxID=1296121 RepID=A0A1A6ADK7_9TREE|nr:uncharacterized protein I303_02343 [Kwoniella dejecticola CBS 10117]OBR88124.1 hypothetical protein I303_02343 [Kwoniella dejecticola CBS 10117]